MWIVGEGNVALRSVQYFRHTSVVKSFLGVLADSYLVVVFRTNIGRVNIEQSCWRVILFNHPFHVPVVDDDPWRGKACLYLAEDLKQRAVRGCIAHTVVPSHR